MRSTRSVSLRSCATRLTSAFVAALGSAEVAYWAANGDRAHNLASIGAALWLRWVVVAGSGVVLAVAALCGIIVTGEDQPGAPSPAGRPGTGPASGSRSWARWAPALLPEATLKEVVDAWATAGPAGKPAHLAPFAAASQTTGAFFFGAFMAMACTSRPLRRRS
jgi:hypothetical protein